MSTEVRRFSSDQYLAQGYAAETALNKCPGEATRLPRSEGLVAPACTVNFAAA